MSMTLFEHEPLSRHTTYKIGGPARWFARIRQYQDLKEALEFQKSHQAPFTVLGGGSNVLVSDEGFDGLVMKMEDKASEIKGTKIVASAGAILAMIAHQAVEAGLTGMEWAFGIPGTLGGAVKGNAGAFGGSMADIVALVEAVDPLTGERFHLTPKDLTYAYRSSIFFEKPWIVTHAILNLAQSDRESCRALLTACLEKKKASQPLGAACAGSTFRNVALDAIPDKSLIPVTLLERPTIPAGYFIEQVGLKNHIAGNAIISPKHANFIINLGGATARDVRELIALAARKVKHQFGVDLIEEIRYIGFREGGE